MKLIYLTIFFICAIYGQLCAGELDADRAHDLIQSLVQDLKKESNAFPIINQLQEGKYIRTPGRAGNVYEGYVYKNKVSTKELKPGKDGRVAAMGSKEVVEPGGINFYIYFTSSPIKMENTNSYSLTTDPSGPTLVYFLRINPENKDLMQSVKLCIEAELSRWKISNK